MCYIGTSLGTKASQLCSFGQKYYDLQEESSWRGRWVGIVSKSLEISTGPLPLEIGSRTTVPRVWAARCPCRKVVLVIHELKLCWLEDPLNAELCIALSSNKGSHREEGSAGFS